MATMVFAMPIIPGKEQVDRQNIQRNTKPGADHDAFVASRRAAGITREAVWHQKTPERTMAIVLMEADDPEAAMRHMMTAQDAFTQRFLEEVKDVHGVDMATEPPPLVELIADMRI